MYSLDRVRFRQGTMINMRVVARRVLVTLVRRGKQIKNLVVAVLRVSVCTMPC